MAANLPPNGPALLTVGAIAVLLQAWLTSSPTVPPTHQTETPRKPPWSTRALDTASPGAHQYGTQVWHAERRAGERAAGEHAAGRGADGKGTAQDDAQENGPHASGRSSRRPTSTGTRREPPEATEESEPELLAQIEPEIELEPEIEIELEIEPTVLEALAAYGAAHPALEPIALDAAALEALLHLAGANPSKREARGHVAALRALGYTHLSAAGLQRALRDYRASHPAHEERAALE